MHFIFRLRFSKVTVRLGASVVFRLYFHANKGYFFSFKSELTEKTCRLCNTGGKLLA